MSLNVRGERVAVRSTSRSKNSRQVQRLGMDSLDAFSRPIVVGRWTRLSRRTQPRSRKMGRGGGISDFVSVPMFRTPAPRALGSQWARRATLLKRSPFPLVINKRPEELKGLLGLGADRHRVISFCAVARTILAHVHERAAAGKESRLAPAPAADGEQWHITASNKHARIKCSESVMPSFAQRPRPSRRPNTGGSSPCCNVAHS
jgi:hypothetical protein